MSKSIICPVCKSEYSEPVAFCPECGCNLKDVDAVHVSVKPSAKSDSVTSSVRSRIKEIGKIAQKGISDVSSIVSEKAGEVSLKASNVVVEEKVTEAMGNLVNLMINVSRDLLTQIPSETLNAVDLEAEINFIAFTIGVSIDLRELKESSSTKRVHAL
jgi:hypothetical protein